MTINVDFRLVWNILCMFWVLCVPVYVWCFFASMFAGILPKFITITTTKTMKAIKLFGFMGIPIGIICKWYNIVNLVKTFLPAKEAVVGVIIALIIGVMGFVMGFGLCSGFVENKDSTWRD